MIRVHLLFVCLFWVDRSFHSKFQATFWDRCVAKLALFDETLWLYKPFIINQTAPILDSTKVHMLPLQ